MKYLFVFLVPFSLIAIGCAPAASTNPTSALLAPSPTPSHEVPMPWLLPDGQYVFIETTMEVDSAVVDGNPPPGQNVDMPTYDFDAVTGVLKSRAGFMPPRDAKVIIGFRRILRGPVGAGVSSVLAAYSSLPAGSGDMIRVVAVDGEAAARLDYRGQAFILKPQESKEFSATENQPVAGGTLRLTTRTRAMNWGAQSLSKISATP